MRLFASDYPVRRIWEANQADYRGDQTANLAEGQVKLLIARRVSGIEMQVLLEDEYLFLDGCARGLKLADAYQLAVNLVPEFDLTRALANYVRENVLVNFRN